MITRYGYDTVLWVCLVAIALLALGWWIDIKSVRIIFSVLAVVLLSFTLYFFRDPERTVPPSYKDGNSIISPADGEVVVIQDIEEKEFLRGPATQISIFLSPLNVHVNRMPITGHITFFRYVAGKYVVAYADKASDINERTHIGIETSDGKKIFMKQIAGFIARRIVCPVHVGDSVTIGERFGMIKFGSRTDIILPRGTEITVKVGDIAVGGETLLAKFH